MEVQKKTQVKPVQRHRKVIRDSIQGITKPAIRRLYLTAGAKRSSGQFYEEVRGILKVKMENILRCAISAMEHSRRKTLLLSDLEIAIAVESGEYLGVGLNKNAEKTFTTRKARQRSSKADTTEANADTSGVKKAHRFKPGTVALREIRYQQKNSDTFAIRKRNFTRLVREIGQDYEFDLRYSGAFMEVFQLIIETYLVRLIHQANRIAIHCHRQTVTPADLRVARVIRGEGVMWA